MSRKRPTARDRDIAQYFAELPLGTHEVIIQSAMSAPYKAEGGMIVREVRPGVSMVVVPEMKS